MVTSGSARATPSRDGARWRVGVDGGGTGTRARLQRVDGATFVTLGPSGHAGPSGLSQGVSQAWRHVEAAVAAAFAAAGLPAAPRHEIALGLGLAGAGVAAQRAAFLAADPGYARCVLDTDATTQLIGVHGGRAGIVVACGTGSVAAIRSADGCTRQAGGWGFPVGDEGSGAWLGLHAMQHAHAVLDRRAEADGLAGAVCAAAGSDAAALLAWCAAAGQAAYASLAPLVFSAAEGGDVAAVALLDRAAAELARLVAALDGPGTAPAPTADAGLPVVVVGGVGERLIARWPATLRVRVVEPLGDSADGALRLLDIATTGTAA